MERKMKAKTARTAGSLTLVTMATAILFALSAAGCCGKYKDQIAEQNKTIDGLTKEKAELGKAKLALETELTGLKDYNNALQTELEKLGFDKAKLSQKYADIQKDLNAKVQDLDEKQKMIDEMKKKEAAAKARLETLKGMLDKFKSMIEAGKLKVKVKNGKMILELPSAILFPSGVAELSDEGNTVLTQVADVLKEIKGREFQVAGHTDNVPIKTKKFKSNWQLSTERAVSVVTFLQEKGVNAKNLSAAGYSEYQPTANNDNEDGKAQNRRIEITLMPNLDELPDLSDLEKEIGK
jgi:chemotaxis protein MotB